MEMIPEMDEEPFETMVRRVLGKMEARWADEDACNKARAEAIWNSWHEPYSKSTAEILQEITQDLEAEKAGIAGPPK